MTWTPEQIWAEMWPDEPFSEASEADVKLVTDHAASLNMYEKYLETR